MRALFTGLSLRFKLALFNGLLLALITLLLVTAGLLSARQQQAWWRLAPSRSCWGQCRGA